MDVRKKTFSDRYVFSEATKSKNIVREKQTLFEYFADVKQFIPGTKRHLMAWKKRRIGLMSLLSWKKSLRNKISGLLHVIYVQPIFPKR